MCNQSGAGEQAGYPAKPQVLIVEDDELIVGLVERILQQEGCQTMACAEGGQAMAYLQTNIPDFIMLDNNLPDMSGEEVFAWLDQQPQLQAVRVVIMSGESLVSDQLIERAMVHLVKPFGLNKLREIAALFKSALG